MEITMNTTLGELLEAIKANKITPAQMWDLRPIWRAYEKQVRREDICNRMDPESDIKEAVELFGMEKVVEEWERGLEYQDPYWEIYWEILDKAVYYLLTEKANKYFQMFLDANDYRLTANSSRFFMELESTCGPALGDIDKEVFFSAEGIVERMNTYFEEGLNMLLDELGVEEFTTYADLHIADEENLYYDEIEMYRVLAEHPERIDPFA